MSNPIGFDPTKLKQLIDQNITQSAFQRGDVGRTAKKEQAPATQPEDVLAAAVRTEHLAEGKERTTYADGRCATKAPNGMMKEELPDGSMNLSLPNGMCIQRDADGHASVYDPNAGDRKLPVDQHQESPRGQITFTYKDSKGDHYKVTSNTLRFEVTNATHTMREKVQTNGTVTATTSSLIHDPRNGHIADDHSWVRITPEGAVHKRGEHMTKLTVDQSGVAFNERSDVDAKVEFPYPPPQLGAKPTPPAPPSVPPCIPTPPPAPVPGAPADPGGPVMTASGVIRQTNPDGSLFISLPNGLVVHENKDGSAVAYDVRTTTPLPATVKNVTHPTAGPEKELDFQDALGNSYQVFSKSLDFIATSPDKNVQEVVYPQGNIFIGSRTFSTDPSGQPVPKYHKAEVLPGGLVNTFGEKGVFLTNGTISFTDDKKVTTYPLPYPMPVFQGYLDRFQGPYPTQPVSGTVPQPGGFAGAPGGPMLPPGTLLPGYGPGPVPVMPPVSPAMPGQSFTPAPGAPNAPAAPQSPAHKPGLWQRLKDAFSGGGPYAQMPNTPAYPGSSYIVPPAPHDPYADMAKMMMITTGITTAFSAISLIGMMGSMGRFSAMPFGPCMPMMF